MWKSQETNQPVAFAAPSQTLGRKQATIQQQQGKGKNSGETAPAAPLAESPRAAAAVAAAPQPAAVAAPPAVAAAPPSRMTSFFSSPTSPKQEMDIIFQTGGSNRFLAANPMQGGGEKEAAIAPGNKPFTPLSERRDSSSARESLQQQRMRGTFADSNPLASKRRGGGPKQAAGEGSGGVSSPVTAARAPVARPALCSRNNDFDDML